MVTLRPAKEKVLKRHWSQIKRTLLIIQKKFSSSLWPQAEAPAVADFAFSRERNQIKKRNKEKTNERLKRKQKRHSLGGN